MNKPILYFVYKQKFLAIQIKGSIIILFQLFLFRCLERSPGGPIFFWLCMAVRAVEGAGFAAYLTSSLAVLVRTFPTNPGYYIVCQKIFHHNSTFHKNVYLCLGSFELTSVKDFPLHHWQTYPSNGRPILVCQTCPTCQQARS